MTDAASANPDPPRVTVVGIGADGWLGLSPPARELIEGSAVLIGAQRQLELVPAQVAAQRRTLPSPLRSGLPGLLAEYAGLRVTVLASGDPLVSGIGATLISMLGPQACRIVPAVSSVALARAEMGWPAESTDVVTLVGRDASRLLRVVSPGRRVIALSSDASTPAAIADLLVSAGFGPSPMSVLSELGSPTQGRVDAIAERWDAAVPALNLVCIQCVPSPGVSGYSVVAGLPDEAFEHDGQLSKRDVRASALARLAPAPGQLLWDVGAGAGSVAIEWARIDPRCRAVAIERDEGRAERITDNCARLGVPDVVVVRGAAPEALADLDRPDAIFIGGGATVDGVLERCWAALPAGGHLVVHGVTLQTEQLLMQWYGECGGELVRVSVERAEPIGSFSGWKPARPVVQWSVRKP